MIFKIKLTIIVCVATMGHAALGAVQTIASQTYESEPTIAASQDYKTIASSEQEYGGGGNGQEYAGVQMGYGGGDAGYAKEEKHPHQPYGFGYNVDDGYGNKHWHHEKSSSPHTVSGTYGYKDKNGIFREVNYIADDKGFRAIVKTTEPGTASNNPAYVKMEANPVAVKYVPAKKQGQTYGKTQGGGNEGGYAQQQGGNEQYAQGDSYSESKSSVKYSNLDGGKTGAEMYGDMSGAMYNSAPTANGVNNALTSKHVITPKYQDKKK